MIGPDPPVDPLLSALQSKGYAHEENFLKSLEFPNNQICKIKKTNKEQMFSETKKAMNEGKNIIATPHIGGMNIHNTPKFEKSKKTFPVPAHNLPILYMPSREA